MILNDLQVCSTCSKTQRIAEYSTLTTPVFMSEKGFYRSERSLCSHCEKRNQVRLPTELFQKSLFFCRIKSGTKQQKEQTNSGLHDKVKKKLKWQTNPSLLMSHHILRFFYILYNRLYLESEKISFVLFHLHPVTKRNE